MSRIGGLHLHDLLTVTESFPFYSGHTVHHQEEKHVEGNE